MRSLKENTKASLAVLTAVSAVTSVCALFGLVLGLSHALLVVLTVLAAASSGLAVFLISRAIRPALAPTLDEKEKLASWQAYTQRLLDACPGMVYVRAADGTFKLVNESFATDRGKSCEEMVGSSFCVAEDSLIEDARVLSGERIAKEEWRLHPVQRVEVCRLHTKRAGLDAEGNPVVIGSSYDITDLRATQRALQAALEREQDRSERTRAFMQRLLDVIPQPVYVKNDKSVYLMVNDAFAKHRGVPKEVIIGESSVTPTFAKPMNPDIAREIAATVSNEDAEVLQGAVIFKEESRPHPETGQELYRIISKQACLDVEGNQVIVGANFDVTQWRQAERRAEHASAAKSLFLASMSHEIRTPLSGVIGMLRMVLRRDTLEAEPREQLGISLKSAESLLAIINDILDFSKIEAGQLSLEIIDYDLHAMLQEAVQPFSESVRTSGPDFQLHIDSAVPQYVQGDPTRLRQILMNLVGNAMKFTPNGMVIVAVDLDAQQGNWSRLRFRVKDNGIGISEEALPRLFQMFQQADNSTTRKYGGTGLGLAICKQLVEAMGGQISVDSLEGLGTTFTFVLPLQHGVAPPLVSERRLVGQTHRLHILCAEDEPVNQLIIGNMLEEIGHRVEMAGDGIQAVQALARTDFDLVLMDGRMPNMDGYDATRAIRAGGLTGLPVINRRVMISALTANVSQEDRARCRGSGMDDFLVKPVDDQELHRVLDAAVQRGLAEGKKLPAL